MNGILPRVGRGARDDRGAVAIIVAISLVGLLVVVAMVLDFGLARLDRQENKSVADDAVTAGIRGFDKGTGLVYSYAGVCDALDFLKANAPELSSLSWSANCTAAKKSLVCDPTDSTTWASFSGTVNGYTVRIESPYTLPDSAFPEDSLPSLSGDDGQPCDQLGVIITQSRKPGLGSLATSSDLTTTVRSVGRVTPKQGDLAPALILLDRTHCGVLVVGSSGSPSRIIVKGNNPIPASIHADSNASDSGCGSGPNQQLMQGHQANGIVAYGAVDPTGTVSGTITAVAALTKPSTVVSDGISNVYGTTGIYPSSGTPSGVQGRPLVGRSPVDQRYLPGVTAAVEAAYPQWLQSHSAPPGYTRFGCPTAADMTTMAGMTTTNAVYIDCPGNSGITLSGAIGAGTIYFHGYIKGGVLKMPNAQKIYVDDTDNSGAKVNNDAIVLNNNDAFCVRATGCTTGVTPPDPNQCPSTSLSPTAKAQLIIRRGNLNGAGNSSLLRLCNTTVIMEGGQLGAGTAASPGGCLPTTYGTLPTSSPCPGASDVRGSGQINTSGQLDWTAPNYYGNMDDPLAPLTDAQKQAAWDGGEDLALWDESYGGSSSPTFAMAGGGKMHVAGVFMAPNAAPFQISGGGVQDLSNAQYIVTSFSVGGNATLTMKVDPNNAIRPPGFDFTMVR